MELSIMGAVTWITVLGILFTPINSEIECQVYEEKESPSIFRMLLTPRSTKIPREETKFYLFTRKNQNCFQELNSTTLQHSFFNPKHPTRIIIHGWMNDAFSSMNNLIKDAYLTKGDYNVIVVEWGGLAKDVNYDRVSKLVDTIGELVAEFTALLNTETGAPCDSMYLIGHSLGAQIAGVVGHLSRDKFNTIFVLDPAEPNFDNPETNSRIDASTAKYVESIHTDMGLLGVNYPAGVAAFFPNYGKKQIGCGFLKDCSHARSYEYFAESINSPKGFWGIQCNSMEEITKKNCEDTGRRGIMAGEPSTPKQGFYYLPTNWEEPFALGEDISVDYWKTHHHHSRKYHQLREDD